MNDFTPANIAKIMVNTLPFTPTREARIMADVMRYFGHVDSPGDGSILIEFYRPDERPDLSSVDSIEKAVDSWCSSVNKTYSIQNYLTLEKEYLKIYFYDKSKDSRRMPLSHPEPRFGFYT